MLLCENLEEYNITFPSRMDLVFFAMQFFTFLVLQGYYLNLGVMLYWWEWEVAVDSLSLEWLVSWQI